MSYRSCLTKRLRDLDRRPVPRLDFLEDFLCTRLDDLEFPRTEMSRAPGHRGQIPRKLVHDIYRKEKFFWDSIFAALLRDRGYLFIVLSHIDGYILLLEVSDALCSNLKTYFLYNTIAMQICLII